MARDSSSSRPPAQVVGGQRRRLARRANPPRSNTMPNLNPESAAAGLTANATNPVAVDGQAGPNVAVSNVATSPLETSQSMSNFHLPSTHTLNAASNSGALTPTSSSSSTTLTDNKKKHGFFDNFKFGSRNTTEPTPLPPQTPTKAAKLLGLDLQQAGSSHLQGDGASDEPDDRDLVHPIYRASSKSVLTTRENGARDLQGDSRKANRSISSTVQHGLALLSPRRRTRNDEFGLDDEDLVNDRPSLTAGSAEGLEANHIYSQVNLLPQRPPPPVHEREHLPEAPQTPQVPQAPPRPAQSRRVRKKDGKPLELMVPVQEASIDDMNTAYNQGVTATPKRSTSLQAASETPNEVTHGNPRIETVDSGLANKYELDAEDLSPTDKHKEEPRFSQDLPDEEKYTSDQGPSAAIWLRSPLQRVENRLLDVTKSALSKQKDTSSLNEYGRVESIIDTYHDGDNDGEEVGVHPGVPVDLSKMKLSQPDTLHLHQPERPGQDCFLSPMEAEAEAILASLDKSAAVRAENDAIIAAGKVKHENFKLDFAKMKASQLTPIPSSLTSAEYICPECDREIHSIDTRCCGLVPLRKSIARSIDLEEEPTVHTAREMKVLRVTPGMVKLVDIPARKKKAGGPQGGEVPPPPPPK